MISADKTQISLEDYFKPFRENVVGYNQEFDSPYGKQRIVYADWTASGRLYGPIEKKILEELGPYVGNTHTETSLTGILMTKAYHQAHQKIKKHVNANSEDIIITAGSGMTGVVNKFQRILGIRIPEKYANQVKIEEEDRPVVFISHMEHHSNHTSWIETIADVECILPNEKGLINEDHFLELVERYQHRKTKIASLTACSNVTGIETEYTKIARIMHENGGMCFVDFACSGPYVKIDMHPDDPLERLDAIYFSPHKFLGGPGTPGVLIFNKSLYNNKVPDQPGGGTVAWTNPWGQRKYFDDIEAREDGGTPAFLQTIKAALAINLKEKMGIELMEEREKELVKMCFNTLDNIPNLHLLAKDIKERLGVISFYIEGLHFNLGVKILNDRFGIQVRGGCSCAGTYGHYLLDISQGKSKSITDIIDQGDLTVKPGWIRMSVHPIMTNEEVQFILDAIAQLSREFHEWSKDYEYNPKNNEFFHKKEKGTEDDMVSRWLEV
ncbi:aminotransferase class V-fold PLP-dependent enzyme [Flexithrix dorotheae]|uniref:aminotransferase class V-fold PLP-dependent enzyme n=1 Tax=Flexithrix dorotheae TaxID=70993 RepID=UPI00036467DA|nr:aminotransferase class V-fold PLP-dependent enzyme [Flexithrix dorotheae]